MSIIDVSTKRKGAFNTALIEAEKGDEIIYSIGIFLGGQHRDDAWNAYEGGIVALYQRRKGKVFHYIAKRIK